MGLGVAVREEEEGAEGRFVIFLPTEMETGTGAHINAPFFGSLDRRRIQFYDEYNRMLLECVVNLSLDAVRELATGEPEDARGRAIVDILASHGEVGKTGKSMLSERAATGRTPLNKQLLLLCDGGWTASTEARWMPQVADGLVIGADEWRQAATFAVVSRALEGRKSAVKRLLESPGDLAEPTDEDWIWTVERVALRVKSGEIDANWDGFFTSVLSVLPWGLKREPKAGADDAFALAGFLPEQNGRLISAGDPVRVFFQPVIGTDDAAELVDNVPDSLKKRIAFIHSEVQTHEDRARRRSTEVHKFLDGRFARGFRREEIIRDVVLPALPPMPASFESDDATLCGELLEWTLGLLGEDPSTRLLEMLKDLPVACHGGWRTARDASFGPGWPEEARKTGTDLCVLCEELNGDAAERLRQTVLLDPGDPRWGLDAGEKSSIFAQIGVAEGLRLTLVDDVKFHVSGHEYELPNTVPHGVDGAAWEHWRTAIRHEAKPCYDGRFPYSLVIVYHLTEL